MGHVRIEVSQVDRPPADVFRFVAVEHVRNHPRPDPKMELEQLSDAAIGSGRSSAGAIRAPVTRCTG